MSYYYVVPNLQTASSKFCPWLRISGDAKEVTRCTPLVYREVEVGLRDHDAIEEDVEDDADENRSVPASSFRLEEP